MFQYLCALVTVASLSLWTSNFVGCQNDTSSMTIGENREAECESGGSSDESYGEYSNQEETIEEKTNRGQKLEFENFPGRVIQPHNYNADESRTNDESDQFSDHGSTTSVVDEVVGKADSLVMFFDKIFQKADDKVSALNERISNMRTRLPGVAYGGSLMTVYYTMIPIFRNTKDVVKKVFRVGNNALRWLGGKSYSRSAYSGRRYFFRRKKVAGRAHAKFSNHNRQPRQKSSRSISRQRRLRSWDHS